MPGLQFQTYTLIAAGAVIVAGVILLILRRTVFPPSRSPVLQGGAGRRRGGFEEEEEVGEKPELVDVWAKPRHHFDLSGGVEDEIGVDKGGAAWRDMIVCISRCLLFLGGNSC